MMRAEDDHSDSNVLNSNNSIISENNVISLAAGDERRNNGQSRRRGLRIIISPRAKERREKFRQAQRRILNSKRKERIKAGWKKAGNFINKINIGKWIDNLERDQELADQLEIMNNEIQQENERKQLVQQVKDECMKAIEEHLISFIREYPDGTYEEWIQDLHPDNVTDNDIVDARFYVPDSDHRIIWNQYNSTSSTKHVPPQNMYH